MRTLTICFYDLLSPIFFHVNDSQAMDIIVQEGVDDSAQHDILKKFDGKIGAFAYMIFILLYFPCISVFGVMLREIGLMWAIFSALWSTVFAYAMSSLFYQCGKWIIVGEVWITPTVIAISILVTMLTVLKYWIMRRAH